MESETLSAPEKMKGDCPKCGPGTNADVLHAHHQEQSDEDGEWSTADFAMLKCCGCERVYFRQARTSSLEWENDYDPDTGETITVTPETVTYWPSERRHFRRQSPNWLFELEIGPHQELASLLGELYAAVNQDHLVLATIGIRTAFDCVSDILGVDPAISFSEKIKQLQANGKIGIEEKDILRVLTEAGHAAAHRGWKPKHAELDSLLTALETFVQRNLILKHEMRQVESAVPHRPPRTKT